MTSLEAGASAEKVTIPVRLPPSSRVLAALLLTGAAGCYTVGNAQVAHVSFVLPPVAALAGSAAIPTAAATGPGAASAPAWSPALQSEEDATPGYGWRGLIWQSVEFDVAENGFRIPSDYVMRDLLAHKPFWHDWIASNKQWNMGRFSDGDNFLVDEIGHPIQGAVSAFIEIQNSPTDSRIEWGDPGYVRSRFKGFLWATVFSTHEKISPAGEAGVGNDGGFTYGNQCHYTCNSSNFGPGTSDTKYTNNTGWTDFVITPTAGMLWVLAEDVLDKDVSDRLSEAYPDKMWPKFVRGGLNPSRSFANLLRWREPWYRDFQHSVVEAPRVRFFPSEGDEAWRVVPRFQVAPFLSGFSLASNTAACFNCRAMANGVGVQGTAHIRGWLGFDSVVTYHSGASPLPSDRAGGDMVSAAFGLSATKQWHYYSAHLALRPGLVHYNRAYETSPQSFVINTYPQGVGTTQVTPPGTIQPPGVIDANGTPEEPKLGSITHFSWDVDLSVDYRLTKRLSLRTGISENLVRYRTDKVNAPGIGAPPYLSWLSKENFINRGNYSYQLGPVFSF